MMVEAHASLAAWYYQMAEALHSAGARVEPPSEQQRRAYVSQMGSHFPEIAHVTRTVTEPRAYVPPPVIPAPAAVMENEGVIAKPPPPSPPPDGTLEPARLHSTTAEPRQDQATTAPGANVPAAPPPPPIVDPSKVKY